MSDKTEAIVAALTRASAGISDAQRQITAANATADEIAAWGRAQFGWDGVAQGLGEVAVLLQDSYGQLRACDQSLGRAAALVGQTHTGMSPALVIKHLTEASRLLDTARSEQFTSLDHLDKAISHTHAALEGAQAGPLAGMIESAKQTVRDTALREANTAQDAIAAVIDGGGQLGNQ